MNSKEKPKTGFPVLSLNPAAVEIALQLSLLHNYWRNQ